MTDPLVQMAQAILGAETQKAIAAENPYYQVANVPTQVSNSLGQLAFSGALDPKDALIAQALTGIVGSTIKNFGDPYQDTLEQRYVQAFNDPTIKLSSSGLNKDLFRRAGEHRRLFEYQQQDPLSPLRLQKEKDLRDLQNRFMGSAEYKKFQAIKTGAQAFGEALHDMESMSD